MSEQKIILWPDGAPGSEGWTQVERSIAAPDGNELLVNVTVPTLIPFLPDESTANGTAMIVAPGGGFRFLSMNNEGRYAASWLRDHGVAAYVLTYRLLDTGTTDEEMNRSTMEMLLRIIETKMDAADVAPEVRFLAKADAEQAVRYVRGTGAERVGFMGFSAGGILTTDVATTEDPDARPDFVAPIYGASRVDVPADAPPFFSVVAADDGLCLDWCVDAFRAWRAAGRPAELHVYERGGHGFAGNKLGLPTDTWLDRLGDWLAANGWIG